jgi:glyoxylase-like metal-dependent hydrolase (beta-lactamase superfamily II)
VEDVEVLVVTHPHVDHIGLAGIVAERSGAEVVVFEGAVAIARDFSRYAAAADDYAAEIMLAHGVEPHVARTLRDMSALLTGWGASTAVHRAVSDGDVVDLGDRALRVRHCPGHSPYDIALTDEAAGVVAWADHLIDTISSNALVTRPAQGWDGKRPTPLLDYRRSLRASRALDLRVALPGHGGPIVDHRPLIDERLADQDARAGRLLELLADGPRSAHELAQAIWGPVAITQAYLTLSEVLGHLDMLLERDAAEEQHEGDVIRFAPR